MAHSSLSFHCIVCYESFDAESRHPVVLPCGHTYICVVCANRLDRCMECRTSLEYETQVISDDGDVHGQSANRNNTPGRRLPSYIQARLDEEARERRRQQRQKANGSKFRHPLPKNLVLLSLMDASTTTGLSSFGSHEHGASSPDVENDNDDEGAKITAGISIATGGCGTYAVATTDGLTVVPYKSFIIPSDLSDDQKSPPNWSGANFAFGSPSHEYDATKQIIQPDYSVDEDMAFEQLTLPSDRTSGGGLRQRNINEDEYPSMLSFGDRVQVVEISPDGWAKLARGRGYVYTDPRHRLGKAPDLVKISGPKDRACLMEGMIHSVALRWMALKHDEEELQKILNGLKKELKHSLQEATDITYIPIASLGDSDNDSVNSKHEDSAAPMTPIRSRGDTCQETRCPVSASSHEDRYQPRKLDQQEEIGSNPNGSRLFSCIIGEVPIPGCGGSTNAPSNQQSRSSTSPFRHLMPLDTLLPHLADGSSISAGSASSSPGTGPRRRHEEKASGSQFRNSSASNNRFNEGARLDFRTGMSGHKALLSSTSRPHDYSERDGVRLMSVHSGLSRSRRQAPWNMSEALKSMSSFPGAARNNYEYAPPVVDSLLTAANYGVTQSSSPERGRTPRRSGRSDTPTASANGESTVIKVPVAMAPPSSSGRKSSVAPLAPATTPVGYATPSRIGLPLNSLDNVRLVSCPLTE